MPDHLLIDFPALQQEPVPAQQAGSSSEAVDLTQGVQSEPAVGHVVDTSNAWQTSSAPPVARTESQIVRDRLNTVADRQVQCILDSPLFDDELRGKLINVRLFPTPSPGRCVAALSHTIESTITPCWSTFLLAGHASAEEVASTAGFAIGMYTQEMTLRHGCR